MTTFNVPPGCTGVELPNGQKIDANRSGKVIIDDPRAERLALKSQLGLKGVVTKSALGFAHVKENTAVCTGEKCLFTGWGWQTTCPKCGAEMKKVTE